MFKVERSGACNNARCLPSRPSIEGSIPLYAWSGSPLQADSDKQCFSRKVFKPDEPALHSEQEQTRPRQAGYNQSVTGCGSQRRHVVVTQRKLMLTAWSSSSNWIWLRWAPHTF